jgi:hypothetical protein
VKVAFEGAKMTYKEMLLAKMSIILVKASSQELEEIDSNTRAKSSARATPSPDIAPTTAWMNLTRFVFPDTALPCVEGRSRAKRVRRDSRAKKSTGSQPTIRGGKKSRDDR